MARPSFSIGSHMKATHTTDDDLFTDQAIPSFDAQKLKEKDKEKVQRMR